MNEATKSLFGLLVGGGIGYAFGLIQNAAIRKYTRMQELGKFKSGLTVIPGSMTRTAYLLALLGLVQVLCPILFVGASQWWISAGVALGYGAILYRNLVSGISSHQLSARPSGSTDTR